MRWGSAGVLSTATGSHAVPLSVKSIEQFIGGEGEDPGRIATGI